MIKLLTASFNNITREFQFSIRGRQVCEMGYLRILGKILLSYYLLLIVYSTCYCTCLFYNLLSGLITSVSKHKPEQWTNCKNFLLGRENETSNNQQKSDVKYRSKFEHAVVFIKYTAEMFAETGYVDAELSGENDTANRPDVVMEEETRQEIRYLPYDKPLEAFLEYKAFYEDEEKHLNPREKKACGLTVFRQALASLSKEIKLRTARGAFETCSICNNLNDILKNTKMKWTKDQLSIVVKLKRLHSQQQAAERRDASIRKLKAKTSFVGSK